MKLFLSSQDMGAFAEDLRQLVGSHNRKTLLIANARDFADLTVRNEVVQRKLKMMRDAGSEPVELDLRQYFSKDPQELEEYIRRFDPGLVCTTGGSTFLLGTSLAASGMSKILRRHLELGNLVYAGYSAGAMVASKNLENYQRDDLGPEMVPEYYNIPAVTDGLGLIEEYIIPHADQEKYRKDTEFYQNRLKTLGVKTITLNNLDAYIVSGDSRIIKRA